MFLCNLCQSFLELLEPTSSQFRSARNLTVREILDLSLRGISLYRAMNSVELVNLVRVGQPEDSCKNLPQRSYPSSETDSSRPVAAAARAIPDLAALIFSAY